MIESGETCFLKLLSNVTPKVCVWCGAMTKDIRMEEMSKFAALSGCTYNAEICFVGTEPNFIVCHPARYITETVSKLFKGKISSCCR